MQNIQTIYHAIKKAIKIALKSIDAKMIFKPNSLPQNKIGKWCAERKEINHLIELEMFVVLVTCLAPIITFRKGNLSQQIRFSNFQPIYLLSISAAATILISKWVRLVKVDILTPRTKHVLVIIHSNAVSTFYTYLLICQFSRFLKPSRP